MHRITCSIELALYRSQDPSKGRESEPTAVHTETVVHSASEVSIFCRVAKQNSYYQSDTEFFLQNSQYAEAK